VEPANAEAVEKLVLDKLAALAKEGFSSSAIEAAINTIEFSLRENNTGSFPRGLSLMLRAMGAWIYDKDPYVPIQWEEALNHFKARLASDKDVFGPLIEKYLLKNNHRATVIMLPDPELGKKTEEQEKERLEKERAAMVEAQLKKVCSCGATAVACTDGMQRCCC
jgi:Zn-dependent M16 (insulinase) family peptidase